jgi:hypothetical protein
LANLYSPIDDLATLPAPAQSVDANTFNTAHVLVLSGSAAILAQARLLEEFAGRTGQFAAMHGLHFTLHHEYAARKTPHLVCLVSQNTPADPISLENLLGCVLLFEYRAASRGTGMMATGDRTGIRTVFGAAEHRTRIATIAAAAMLRRRAHIVLVSYKQQDDSLSSVAFPSGVKALWAAQTREIRDYLPLLRSFDETLATIGKRTRTHLRYYRRRLQEEIECDFIPDVRHTLDPNHLADLNASSLDPIAPTIFHQQYTAAAELPGGFVCGLRTRDGRWMSLAGGWRQQTTCLIQWQMNAKGFEKFSLGTAFRAFLIEHEIAQGTTRLCFHGGTSHPMHHSFPAEYVVDLVLRRSSPLTSLVVGLTPTLAEKTNSLAERGNFLADVLRKRDLTWLATAPSTQPNAPTGTTQIPR